MAMVTAVRISVVVFVIGSISAAKHPNIVGGNNAVIKSFPFLVSLRYNGDHNCGGSIISNKHILTAAHCIFGMDENDLDNLTIHSATSRRDVVGKVHRILSLHSHPKFDISNSKDGYPYDIAVLTLKDPIIFDKRQQKINLPSDDVQKYQAAYVIGWGMTSNMPHRERIKQLQKLRVALLPYDECKPLLRHKMNRSQVCAFRSSRTGACHGDSGGPLVSNGAVVGIVSYGDRGGMCAANAPDVYTNVFTYKDYIESIMKE